jgi:hypothetical protein
VQLERALSYFIAGGLSSTNFRFGFLSESSLQQTSLEHRAFRNRFVSHDCACENRYWASLVRLVNVHPLSVGLTNLVAAAAAAK